MIINYKDQSTADLQILIQEMEHAYAEAFEGDVDAFALKDLWKQIKMVKSEIAGRTSFIA